MIKKLITLLIISMFFTYNSFAGEVFTTDQIAQLLSETCKIDKNFIYLSDELYEVYDLKKALTKAVCTDHDYKSNLFDCDDIANSIRSIVIRYIAEQNVSGGAVMFGNAYIADIANDTYHVVNILIANKKGVYIYDYQEMSINDFQTPDYYLKKKMIFEFIQM